MTKLHHAEEDYVCDHCDAETARIGLTDKEGETVDDDMFCALCVACAKAFARDIRELCDKEGLRRKLNVQNGEEQ